MAEQEKGFWWGFKIAFGIGCGIVGSLVILGIVGGAIGFIFQ
jgi:hypothetical protein